MGENPKYVFLTGSPGLDEVVNNKITNKKDLEKKYDLKFGGNEILLLQHPVTTQTELSGKQILNTLKAIAKTKKTTIAIAPNSDAGNKIIFKYLESFSRKYDFIRMYRSLPRSDYLGLLKNCGMLVGNSSRGMIEANYFQIPVINIGIRQEGREKGKNVFDLKDTSVKSIYHTILKTLKIKKSIKLTNIYGIGNASKKILRYLEKINLSKNLIQKNIFY